MAKKKGVIEYQTGTVEGAEELEEQLNDMLEIGLTPKFITEHDNCYTIVYER